MPITGSVTAVVINYGTPELVLRAVNSFRQFYPQLPLLLIDNGSPRERGGDLSRFFPPDRGATEIVTNPRNFHHGPAMNQALTRPWMTPAVLFLDSDCVVRGGGFVEEMLSLLERDPSAYAVGKKVMMNKRGFITDQPSGAIEYIRPICMLLKTAAYATLPPFERHGAPCLKNFRAARELGLTLVDFPVEKFVDHQGRGTAGRYGYRLGWRGKLNHLLNRLGL